jgi:hypothetical protein
MRQNGYYWVKKHGEWTVAEWNGGYWEMTGHDIWSDDEDFEQIKETRLEEPTC